MIFWIFGISVWFLDKSSSFHPLDFCFIVEWIYKYINLHYNFQQRNWAFDCSLSGIHRRVCNTKFWNANLAASFWWSWYISWFMVHGKTCNGDNRNRPYKHNSDHVNRASIIIICLLYLFEICILVVSRLRLGAHLPFCWPAKWDCRYHQRTVKLDQWSSLD